MPYTKQSVIDAYKRIGNIRGVCEETGCPPYNAYIWLRIEGMLTIDEKCSYGTAGAKLGGDAEKEFQRLVPKAMCANSNIRKCNPVFDFMLGNITIGVKASSPKMHEGRKYWKFETAGCLKGKKAKKSTPDFYCVFLCFSRDRRIGGGYKLLLVPHDLTIGQGAVSINVEKDENEWLNFLIEPDDLASTLAEAADLGVVTNDNDKANHCSRLGKAIGREANKRRKAA
jgi:hypothetical protein